MNSGQRSLRAIGEERRYDAAYALRWLLLLLMWPGPVPWCHSHGAVARSESSQAATWLREHLWKSHAGSLGTDASRAGWHVHFSLPGSDDGESGSEDSRPSWLMAASTADAQESGAESTSGGSPLFVTERLASSTRVGVGPNAVNRHFLDGFAPFLALPLRLGVLRC